VLHSSNPNTIYVPGISKRTNGVPTFFHLDWLGSTRTTSSAAGTATTKERYDAWGRRTDLQALDPNNPPNPFNLFHPSDFQWGGGWGSQTEWASATEPGLGLQYLQQRYYDPAVGRFISPDPIGYLGGENLYSYVRNDPVNSADPSGLGEQAEADAAAGPHAG
jgi:RHS repeat-associated protein